MPRMVNFAEPRSGRLWRPPGASGSGGGGEPDSISGLLIWLDASDESTITESGGAVSQWDDKSGNANHFTQGAASKQPTTGTRTLNSLNTLDFTQHYMDCASLSTSLSSPYTVFVVTASDVGSGDGFYRYFFDGISSTERALFGKNDSNGYALFGGDSFADTTATGLLDTNPHVFSGLFKSSAEALWIDGASEALSGGGVMDTLSGVTIGGFYGGMGAAWNGRIAEIVVYNTEVSSADRESVESYLAGRWGVTLS